MSGKVIIYRRRLSRRNQRWRWRLVHNNGKKLANGGEGYSDQGRAVKAAQDVLGGKYSSATMQITIGGTNA